MRCDIATDARLVRWVSLRWREPDEADHRTPRRRRGNENDGNLCGRRPGEYIEKVLTEDSELLAPPPGDQIS